MFKMIFYLFLSKLNKFTSSRGETVSRLLCSKQRSPNYNSAILRRLDLIPGTTKNILIITEFFSQNSTKEYFNLYKSFCRTV